MNVADESAELACVPGAIAASERPAHFELAKELFQIRAAERLALPNGYALRFAPDALEQVAKFIANERKCCPFMTFELELKSHDGTLWLRMTGPAGTAKVLEAELNLANACGCQGECQ